MNNALDIKVDPDVAARLIEHLRHDTTDLADADLFVPITHFTDPRRAQAEIALMKTLPLFIAHESELTAPGDFITHGLRGVTLITARPRNRRGQTTLTICRHRGGGL